MDKCQETIELFLNNAKRGSERVEEAIEAMENCRPDEMENQWEYVHHCENDYAIACKALYQQIVFYEKNYCKKFGVIENE